MEAYYQKPSNSYYKQQRAIRRKLFKMSKKVKATLELVHPTVDNVTDFSLFVLETSVSETNRAKRRFKGQRPRLIKVLRRTFKACGFKIRLM